MCFDPVSITMAVVGAALTTATSAVSNYMQVKSQNQAARQQYQYQQEQQKLINEATIGQFNETISRQRLEAMRAASSNMEQAQQSILENQRRQGAAFANAATAGITGTPLQMLFNDFQVGVGGVANNLQTLYTQINENLFFNLDNARREAQSRVNQAIPPQPYLAEFSALPSVFAGLSTGVDYLSRGRKINPSNTQETKTTINTNTAFPLLQQPSPTSRPPAQNSFVFQGWKYS